MHALLTLWGRQINSSIFSNEYCFIFSQNWLLNINVTLEHKTSLKGQFFEIEIYASSESWINKIFIDVWFVMIGQYLKIWNLRVQKKSKYWENHL